MGSYQNINNYIHEADIIALHDNVEVELKAVLSREEKAQQEVAEGKLARKTDITGKERTLSEKSVWHGDIRSYCNHDEKKGRKLKSTVLCKDTSAGKEQETKDKERRKSSSPGI